MDKYIRDGKVALLIHKNYGSGWYSSNHNKEMLFDPTIVDMVLNLKSSPEEIRAYAILKYPDAYVSTLTTKSLTVSWVDIGRKFLIYEYDGSEEIWIEDDIKWIVA
jgi:hypothetical protein